MVEHFPNMRRSRFDPNIQRHIYLAILDLQYKQIYIVLHIKTCICHAWPIGGSKLGTELLFSNFLRHLNHNQIGSIICTLCI